MKQSSYDPKFAEGSAVEIASEDELKRFGAGWHYHHPITKKHLGYSGRRAIVSEVYFYHGGDKLYYLRGIPRLLWHEAVLRRARRKRTGVK